MSDHVVLAQKIAEISKLTESMDQLDQRIAYKVLLELNTLILLKVHGVSETELEQKDTEASKVMQQMMNSFELYLNRFQH